MGISEVSLVTNSDSLVPKHLKDLVTWERGYTSDRYVFSVAVSLIQGNRSFTR